MSIRKSMSPPLHGTSWFGQKFGDVISERLGDPNWNCVHISNYAVTVPGLQLIETPIIEFLEADPENRIRILVGWDGTTTTTAIRRLLAYRNHSDNRVEISIYHIPASAVENGRPPLFHPKYWVFSNDEAGALFVGSHNLTRSGFSRNIELSLEISGTKEEYPEIQEAIRSVNRFGGWDNPQNDLIQLFNTQINSIGDLQEFIGSHPPPQPQAPPPADNDQGGDNGDEDPLAGNFAASLSQPTTRAFAGLEIPDFQVEEGDEEGADVVAAAEAADAVEADDDEDQEEIPEQWTWWTELQRITLNTAGHLRVGTGENTHPTNTLRLSTGFDPHRRTSGEDYNLFRTEFIPAELWVHDVENGTYTATIEATLVTPGHDDVNTSLQFDYNPLWLDQEGGVNRATQRNIHLRLSTEIRAAFERGVTEQVWGQYQPPPYVDGTPRDPYRGIIDDGNPEIPVGHYIQLQREGVGEDAEYTVSIVPPPA